MSDQPEKVPVRPLAPGQPTQDRSGSVYIPLTGGDWELILDPGGILYLGISSPDLRTGKTMRYLLDIGHRFEDDAGSIEQLVDGVNMIRNQGESISLPN